LINQLIIISEIFLSKLLLKACVCELIEIRRRTISISLCILLSVCLTWSSWIPYASATAADFYSKDESPFGISNSDWVAKYWNWDYSLPIDPQTNEVAGLKENGCLIYKNNSMVMLADTALGGVRSQNCTISHTEGILIPIWTGECNKGAKDCKDMPFDELSKAARNIDLGKVKGLVKVDNIPIAKLDVIDYSTIIKNNVTEVFTKQFNATVPKDTHMSYDQYGTFPSAAHGWFVFLKPLQPGNHTVYYENTVEPTALTPPGNSNTAQFTYHFKVE
jgi:hypothetical protein